MVPHKGILGRSALPVPGTWMKEKMDAIRF